MNYFINPLNEASIYNSKTGNEDIIERLGEIDVFDSSKKSFEKVKAVDIIKTVNDAVYKIHRDYPYLYQFMAKCKIMYIPVIPSEITDTMCVDGFNNLWINCSYVYDNCKMDSSRVFGILFHELFHIFFSHIRRFKEVYPDEMFGPGMEGAKDKAQVKSNICMDYEVNASMVDDHIVSDTFWERMNGLYKKEYTGMTWEEILNNYGDMEYKSWLERNGYSLEDAELKLLDAIEKASKVLMDKTATDDEKREARRELQKTLDEIFGKERLGDRSLQEELEQLAKTKLGDIGDLGIDFDDVIDDLYENPAKMSDEQMDKTLKDIDKLMDDMEKNADEIGSQFGKSSEDVSSDVSKARDAMKDAMEKIKKGGLSKEEKEDLIDAAKDAMEDIISDDVEKSKLKKKREEREAKKREERKEKFKKTHPLRSMIIILENFKELHGFVNESTEETESLISDKTNDILDECIGKLEPLTELYFSEMKKEDIDSVVESFTRLKESFLPDLVALIDNETILNKTEDDMQRLLDGVFETVFNAFQTILRDDLDESAKGSVIKTAAQRLRIIGKVLKTQKVWRVGDDFKKAYIDEMKRLMQIRKDGGDEALFKELFSKGVIEPYLLDENGLELLNKLIKSGDIKSEDIDGDDFEAVKDRLSGLFSDESEERK